MSEKPPTPFCIEIRQAASDSFHNTRANNQAAVGRVCKGEKVYKVGASLSRSLFFILHTISSLSVCSYCNTMNAYKERLSKSVNRLCPCLNDYCISLLSAFECGYWEQLWTLLLLDVFGRDFVLTTVETAYSDCYQLSYMDQKAWDKIIPTQILFK